jgi:hypothetical protein
MLVTANVRMINHLLGTNKVLQSLHLLHAVWNILMTKPILTPSKVILKTSFSRHFQETVAPGILFWMDLKNLT